MLGLCLGLRVDHLDGRLGGGCGFGFGWGWGWGLGWKKEEEELGIDEGEVVGDRRKRKVDGKW